MKVLTSQNFDNAIEVSPSLVLVDFFAEWCGPCKAIAPLLEELDALYPELEIFKVDIDQSIDLAQRFQITGVPTFKFFKGGQPIYTQVGVLDPSSFKALVRSLYDNQKTQEKI